MDEINVIVVSSIRPETSTAAGLTLHRHLVNRSGVRLHILPAEHHEIAHGSFHSKIIPRLMRTSARRWAGDIDYLMHTTLPLEKSIVAPPARARAVVLTVAYGSGCWVAQRYARRHRLPLIVRFDDWWPDIAGVHSPVRKKLERRFLELHQSGDLSLCISEGMLKALGPHRNARVILPIPDVEPIRPSPRKDSAGEFRVGYTGIICCRAVGKKKWSCALRNRSRCWRVADCNGTFKEGWSLATGTRCTSTARVRNRIFAVRFAGAISGRIKFGYLVLRNVCRCNHHNSGTDTRSR